MAVPRAFAAWNLNAKPATQVYTPKEALLVREKKIPWCENCGGQRIRLHRSVWQRFAYSAVYECKDCKKRVPQPRKFTFEFTRNVSCPHCGNQDLKKLSRRDHIEKFYQGPISRLEGLFGANLYHCIYCRLQFFDIREMADRKILEKRRLQYVRPRPGRSESRPTAAVDEPPKEAVLHPVASPAIATQPPAVQPQAPALQKLSHVPPKADCVPQLHTPAVAWIIGQGVCVTGRVSGSADLYIDGEVDGSIELENCQLTIGPNARIRARISARTVVIAGASLGDIEASEKVTITRTGKLTGNIQTADITIEDGAFFKGSINQIKASPPQPPRLIGGGSNGSPSAAIR